MLVSTTLYLVVYKYNSNRVQLNENMYVGSSQAPCLVVLQQLWASDGKLVPRPTGAVAAKNHRIID